VCQVCELDVYQICELNVCIKSVNCYVHQICELRARLAQLQLLILSEDLEEPCQTGIFLN
jgi:hypothetical protein